ncbi:MAG: hypothetical protein JO093_11905 [Acidobacteria bacterium]|nr:hypothetical protein [Acidobacteriota bacterium]MBV9070147.1 hypothetical protein [Acidobacteriota bacterium]MBV9186322.1 hypothetical protein [Acidobacteriota bacterium]
MRLYLSLLVLLAPAIAAADGLTDLRATLGRLPATTPVHGTLDVTSTSRSNEDDKADDGKASVGFEIGESGLHIIYPRATLAQATQEARAEARDPEKSTPVRNGTSHVRPLHVAELLDGAAALSILLESAQFVQTKPANFGGRPARLLSFKLSPKMSKSESKHVKKIDSALSVWVSDDGTPLAAEESTSIKASFLLISFEADQKHNWAYARSGDRLVVTRYESNDKSDGLGQHSTSHTLETIRLE